MVTVFKQFPTLVVFVGMSLAADVSIAQEAATTESNPSSLTKAEGIVMLDYEVIPIPGSKSIDLMGFHFLHKVNDWMYLGIGGYAPLFHGEYGGFMALGVTAHVQRKVFGDLFVDAGLSLGGGGGGKSVQQSKVLSGTGGFRKSYIGLGYDFQDFSVGANIANMKFTKSAIENSQLNVFLQIPFSYAIGSYSSSGGIFSADDAQRNSADSSENMLTLGLDNFRQIDPEGLNKDTINVADLQFSHFITKNSYWYVNVGVGYHGLALYNQIVAGLGYRAPISSRVNLYGELGLGSGGYAPDTINTGSGLLVYPKVSAEYMIDKNLGVSLSAGYLFAPNGSSKNYTFGAALNYHINAGDRGSDASGAGSSVFYRGYRYHLFQQTEFDLKYKGIARSNLNMLSVQADSIVNDHVYIPIQANAAYNAYLDYPGYGELLTGVGLQNRYDKDSRFQWFAQLLVGTNVHGPILKPGIGLNYGLSDKLAIYAQAGQTRSTEKGKFSANYAGFGVTYRYSMPSW